MKTTAIIILILGLATVATAQYARNPANNTGIYATENTTGDKMTIAVNNEKTNFTVDYQLIDAFNKAVLVIREEIGKVIVMEELIDTHGQIIITIDHWPSGNYTVNLFADKKMLMQQKFIFKK